MTKYWLTLLLLLFAAGCAGGKGQPIPLPVAELPPLSSLAGGQQIGTAKNASVEIVSIIPADEFVAKSDNATYTDFLLNMSPGAGELAWAIYGISGLAVDYRPLELTLRVAESNREYFVALSDYEHDRWEIMSEAYTGDAQLDLSGGWMDYVSDGNLYFAVLAWSQQLHYERAEFRIDDLRPLPAPTGLSGASQSEAAALSWDAYPDSRADELRVYQSLNSDMSGAAIAAKVGPGVTTKQITELDNGTTYYFALTAFMFADSLESPMSNTAEVTPGLTGPLAVPSGLNATGLDRAAELNWDNYTDPRASSLYIYLAVNADMTGATEAAIVDVDAVTETISGLTNGQRYYFGLKAYSAGLDEFSEYSNIVSALPEAPSGGALSGIWPRLGNREDNRGVTTFVGPSSLSNWNSADLAPGRETVPNRTSPVIDIDGNVYALSGDAVLSSYNADLSVRHWQFEAADNGTPGTDYVCPPHSPIVDEYGNVYFIAAPKSTSSGTPYLFCVNSSGNRSWRFDMGIVSDDLDLPYPTPNISPAGILVLVIKEKHVIVGLSGGEEEWIYELGEAECHADPAISRGRVEMPIYDGGIGIPENRLHWLSLDAASGEFAVDYRDMGTPANYFGGLPLGGGYFVYPELESEVLLDSSAGTQVDRDATHLDLFASPARNLDSSYVFQPHPPFGFAGTSYLYGFEVSQSEPPSLSEQFSLQLGQASVSGKPAVDGAGKIYFADNQGTLYIVEFNPDLPVGETNPSILDEGEIADSDNFWFNTFALGDGVAYIVNEKNMLYQIYDAGD